MKDTEIETRTRWQIRKAEIMLQATENKEHVQLFRKMCYAVCSYLHCLMFSSKYPFIPGVYGIR